jgi:hypothetical protein
MDQITWGADVAGGVTFNGRVSLSGCVLENAGGPGEGVVLAQHLPTQDANTRHYWPWNDSLTRNDGVSGLDINSVIGPWELDTLSPWQEAGHLHLHSWYRGSMSGDKYTYNPTEGATLELWGLCVADTSERTAIMSRTSGGYNAAVHCRFNQGSVGTLVMGIAGVQVNTTGIASGWHHLAIVADTDSTRLYVDGVMVKSGSVAAGALAGDLYFATNSTSATRYWDSDMDSLAIHTCARYTGATCPSGRYKSALENSGTQPYVDLSETGLSGQVPSAISWNAQTGASYGKVKAVYILDAALGWTAVGGSYPTSPITVSGLTLAADSCLRFALEPKSDTIQSETPTLQDVTLTYATPVTSSPYYYRSLVANRQGRF